MKAVQISSFGGPEVLKVANNVQVPQAKENQVMLYSQIFAFKQLVVK